MAGPATILREIHRLRRHASNLESEIERIPRLLKAQQTKITQQEDQVRQTQESIKRLKIAQHEKEMHLKGIEQQIGKHEKQMNEASSKKEYDALRAEIAAEKTKIRSSEDEILDCMAKIEEATAQLPEAENSVKKAKEELVTHQCDGQVRVASIKEQLDQTLEEIRRVESTLPADIKPMYDRLLSARGEDAMAAADGRICRACYTEITAQNYNDLMLSQFVLCKSCGRVLYLPE